MDLTTPILAILPLGLMLVGLGLVWSFKFYEQRRGQIVSPGSRVAGTAGLLLLVVGLFLAIGLTTHIFMFVIWIATAVILMAVARGYYDAERKSLLWLLTASAERGIPLDAAAMAFAEDRHDRVGLQAARLADYLEAGLPLALALKRSGHRLSPALTLAADVGQQTGSLGNALRQVAQHGESIEKTMRSTTLWLFYLAFLGMYTLVVGVFCITWLLPVLVRIYTDFEIALPTATHELLRWVDLVVSHWYWMVPLWLVLGFIFFLATAHYLGYSIRQLPLLRRLWWRSDCALVLRWLAITVRQNRSLVDVLQLLAVYFPQPMIRRRLAETRQRIARGSHWSDSLYSTGLIRRSENGLFKAAERAGNLPWALDEMAESAVRRSAYRLKGWIDFVFPLAVVAVGGVVLILAVGVLMPIFSLIQVLS